MATMLLQCHRKSEEGHGDEEDQRLPKLVEALSGKKVVQVAVGSAHSMGLTEAGVTPNGRSITGLAELPQGGAVRLRERPEGGRDLLHGTGGRAARSLVSSRLFYVSPTGGRGR